MKLYTISSFYRLHIQNGDTCSTIVLNALMYTIMLYAVTLFLTNCIYAKCYYYMLYHPSKDFVHNYYVCFRIYIQNHAIQMMYDLTSDRDVQNNVIFCTIFFKTLLYPSKLQL